MLLFSYTNPELDFVQIPQLLHYSGTRMIAQIKKLDKAGIPACALSSQSFLMNDSPSEQALLL